MTRYKIIIAYDGTRYCGWQVQVGRDSIQALVQKALQIVLRHSIDLTGSGRTDAGVHAEGQTAHFDTDIRIQKEKFRIAINALLPPDIRVLDLEETLADFHARYSAKEKIYHYYLHLAKISSPFDRLYRYHVFKKLDLEQMKEAARAFLGTHDFTSFANEPQRGSVAHDPIRTLTHLDLQEIEGGVRLEFRANGFLYKMVRNITGTLIACASGQSEPGEIARIIAAKDRRKAFQSVPPQGLFLHRVIY